jgi:hypothetical protein
MTGNYSIQKIEDDDEKLMYEGNSRSEGHLFLHLLLHLQKTNV